MGRTTKTAGVLLAGVVTAGALATAGLGSAPTANATCASFWGINNGGGCTSTLFSVAIAIGTGATATATGIFDTAISLGDNSYSIAKGALNTAVALGTTTNAYAIGTLGIGIGAGFDPNPVKNVTAYGGYFDSDFANIGVAFGSDSVADAEQGFGNIAVSLGQGNKLLVKGSLSTGIAVGGNQGYINNNLQTNGVLNYAFSFGGNKNNVTAGPGPFAIAGSIFQTGATVTKSGPGFNINGLAVGGAAATRPSRVTKPAAATSSRAVTKPAAASRANTRPAAASSRANTAAARSTK